MYVCICHAVTDRELSDVIAAGARSEGDVGRACGAGTGCGSCLDRICARLPQPSATGLDQNLPAMAAS